VGTGLVILSQRTLINKIILGNSVLTWFGQISYAMYLWHWILLVNAKLLFTNELSNLQRASLVFLTIFIAWLSTIFYENPIRYGLKKTRLSLIVLFCMLVLLVLGLNFNKIKTRFNEPSVNESQSLDEIKMFEFFQRRYFPCKDELLYNASLKHQGYIRCYQSKNDRPVDIAIIGDSHAEALFAGIAENLMNKNVVYYTEGGLPYLANYSFANIFGRVLEDEDIKTVIFSSYWTQNYSKDKNFHEKEVPKLLKKFTLAGKKIILLEDVPGFKIFPSNCIRLNICADTVPAIHYQKFKYVPLFKKYASLYTNVYFVPVRDYFCSEVECYINKNNKVLFRDRNHLNIEGSLYLGNKLLFNNRDIFEN
jgi:hypothetical protein